MSQKIKKAKFGHKQFQKGQIFKEILPKYFWQSVSKRPNGNTAMKIEFCTKVYY
jgi:hypothetical protein